MKLLFVYNADNTLFSLIGGAVQKLAAPKTYSCNLCKLTYPLASMDARWKRFIESLPHTVVFLHRDEFKEHYPKQKKTKLPALFAEEAAGLRLLVSAEEMDKAKSVAGLIKIVELALPGQKAKA